MPHGAAQNTRPTEQRRARQGNARALGVLEQPHTPSPRTSRVRVCRPSIPASTAYNLALRCSGRFQGFLGLGTEALPPKQNRTCQEDVRLKPLEFGGCAGGVRPQVENVTQRRTPKVKRRASTPAAPVTDGCGCANSASGVHARPGGYALVCLTLDSRSRTAWAGGRRCQEANVHG
jgi:hypothetical protein